MNVITNAEDVERVARLFEAKHRAQLVQTLRGLAERHERWILHGEDAGERDWAEEYDKAARALLDYLDDPEITAAFDAIAKWYA